MSVTELLLAAGVGLGGVGLLVLGWRTERRQQDQSIGKPAGRTRTGE